MTMHFHTSDNAVNTSCTLFLTTEYAVYNLSRGFIAALSKVDTEGQVLQTFGKLKGGTPH